MDSTQSITGTAYYGDSTHLAASNSAVSRKLSPQSLLATNTEDFPPQNFSKDASQLSAGELVSLRSKSSGSLGVKPHPLSHGPQQGSSHSISNNSIFGSAWGEGQAPSSVVEKDRLRVEKLLDIFRGKTS
jgi:hypothetical protein